MDKWDARFMQLARVIAQWASCYRPNRKIGCVIVKNKRIVTTGYNKQSNREVLLRDIRNIDNVVYTITADNVGLPRGSRRRAPVRSSPSTTPRVTCCGTRAAGTRNSTESTSTTPPCGPIEVSPFPRSEG